MIPAGAKIWLSGEWPTRMYLFDPATGRDKRYWRPTDLSRHGCAGLGVPCGGLFVALFRPAGLDSLQLNIGKRSFALVPGTEVRYATSYRGLRSSLSVDGEVVVERTVPRAILPWVDTSLGSPDLADQDGLAKIAAILSSPGKTRSVVDLWSADKGPWFLAEPGRQR